MKVTLKFEPLNDNHILSALQLLNNKLSYQYIDYINGKSLEVFGFTVPLLEKEFKVTKDQKVSIPDAMINRDTYEKLIESFKSKAFPPNINVSQLEEKIELSTIESKLRNILESLEDDFVAISKFRSLIQIAESTLSEKPELYKFAFIKEKEKSQEIAVKSIKTFIKSINSKFKEEASIANKVSAFNNVEVTIVHSMKNPNTAFLYTIKAKISNPIVNVYNGATRFILGTLPLHGNINLEWNLNFTSPVRAVLSAAEYSLTLPTITTVHPTLHLMNGSFGYTRINGYHGATIGHPFISGGRVCFSDFIADIYTQFPNSLSILGLANSLYDWSGSFYKDFSAPYRMPHQCITGYPKGLTQYWRFDCKLPQNKLNQNVKYCNEIECKMIPSCSYYKQYNTTKKKPTTKVKEVK